MIKNVSCTIVLRISSVHVSHIDYEVIFFSYLKLWSPDQSVQSLMRRFYLKTILLQHIPVWNDEDPDPGYIFWHGTMGIRFRDPGYIFRHGTMRIRFRYPGSSSGIQDADARYIFRNETTRNRFWDIMGYVFGIHISAWNDKDRFGFGEKNVSGREKALFKTFFPCKH